MLRSIAGGGSRADYEYQIWPQSPDIPGMTVATMKPNGVTVGLTYRVF